MTKRNIPEKVLFFVYGTLLSGCGNNVLLAKPNVKFLGEHITEPKYTMVSCGGFPAVHCQGNTPIKGELYETSDPRVIDRVYSLEGYSGIPNKDGGDNHFYDVEFIDTPKGTASMFVFRGRVSDNIIQSGSWKNRNR